MKLPKLQRIIDLVDTGLSNDIPGNQRDHGPGTFKEYNPHGAQVNRHIIEIISRKGNLRYAITIDEYIQ